MTFMLGCHRLVEYSEARQITTRCEDQGRFPPERSGTRAIQMSTTWCRVEHFSDNSGSLRYSQILGYSEFSCSGLPLLDANCGPSNKELIALIPELAEKLSLMMPRGAATHWVLLLRYEKGQVCKTKDWTALTRWKNTLMSFKVS